MKFATMPDLFMPGTVQQCTALKHNLTYGIGPHGLFLSLMQYFFLTLPNVVTYFLSILMLIACSMR